MKGYYRICGLNVCMDSYGRIMQRAAKYECKPFDFADINISSTDIFDLRTRWTEADRFPDISDDETEYLATGALFYNALLQFGGLRFHASTIVVDEKAYLFSADSGTGKSTHTSIWLKLFGERAYILNDDSPAVRKENGIWYAYGTPWSGKHDISVNARVPIAGIAALDRAKENAITPFDSVECVDFLLNQILHSNKIECLEKIFELFEGLIEDVPIWKLQCNMNSEAAIVSYEAMSGEKFVPNK